MASLVSSSAPDFSKFFSLRARAFQNGDFDTVVDAVCVPTSVYVMGQLLVINALPDAVAALEIYHGNLKTTPYAETRTEVLEIAHGVSGKIKVRTRTAHFDAAGQELSGFEVDYYLRERPQAKDGFVIDLIETLSPGNTDLIQGLPLV